VAPAGDSVRSALRHDSGIVFADDLKRGKERVRRKPYLFSWATGQTGGPTLAGQKAGVFLSTLNEKSLDPIPKGVE